MRRSSPTEVGEFYDGSAESYSEMMDTEIDLPLYTDILARLAERIGGLGGQVLDTSCGPGHMLLAYHRRFDPARQLVGVDLSPRMVSIASARLGSSVRVFAGDMRNLAPIAVGSSAAVVSFFAIHHLGPDEVTPALEEWRRVLRPGGQLVIATWEGTGTIDYGGVSDVVAFRYRRDEIIEWTEAAGFLVDRCVVEPVAGLPMDAVYLEGNEPLVSAGHWAPPARRRPALTRLRCEGTREDRRGRSADDW